jgi:hypothetical protein
MNYDGLSYFPVMYALGLIRIYVFIHGEKTLGCWQGRFEKPLLLDQGLVDEISLLVHPVIVGKKSYSMFSETLRSS